MVWDGLRYLPGGPGRVGVPSLRSGMGWWTLSEVWDGLGTLRVVWDGSGYLPGGPGWVGGPSWRSRTGQGTV